MKVILHSGQGAKNTSHFHIVTLLHPSSTSFAKPSFKAKRRFACCSSKISFLYRPGRNRRSWKIVERKNIEYTAENLVYCKDCDETKKVVYTLQYIRVPLVQESTLPGLRKSESTGVPGKISNFYQISLEKLRWLCGLSRSLKFT